MRTKKPTLPKAKSLPKLKLGRLGKSPALPGPQEIEPVGLSSFGRRRKSKMRGT